MPRPPYWAPARWAGKSSKAIRAIEKRTGGRSATAGRPLCMGPPGPPRAGARTSDVTRPPKPCLSADKSRAAPVLSSVQALVSAFQGLKCTSRGLVCTFQVTEASCRGQEKNFGRRAAQVSIGKETQTAVRRTSPPHRRLRGPAAGTEKAPHVRKGSAGLCIQNKFQSAV